MTWTMPYINGKLKHSKPILHQLFTKLCIGFSLFFVSVGRSKKTSTHISLYSLKRSIVHMVGYAIFLVSPAIHFCSDTAVVCAAIISGLSLSFLTPLIGYRISPLRVIAQQVVCCGYSNMRDCQNIWFA